MLKNLRTAAVALATSAALISSAALAGEVTLNSGATIINALGLTTGNTLQFGEITAAATPGTVIITPTETGERSSPDGLALGSGVSGVGPATFDITGGDNNVVVVTMSQASTTLTSAKGGAPMTLDTFTTDVTGEGNTVTLTGGSATVKVGGTLHVNANQADGAYTGTFKVTVAYQ